MLEGLLLECGASLGCPGKLCHSSRAAAHKPDNDRFGISLNDRVCEEILDNTRTLHEERRLQVSAGQGGLVHDRETWN
eukprot:14047497-Alexandrium_andersonii.AAC.1